MNTKVLVNVEEMRARLHRFGFSCAGVNVSSDITALLDELEELRMFAGNLNRQLKAQVDALLNDEVITNDPFSPTFARGFVRGLERAIELCEPPGRRS